MVHFWIALYSCGTASEHSQENVYVYDIDSNGNIAFKDELFIPSNTIMENTFYYNVAVNEDYMLQKEMVV